MDATKRKRLIMLLGMMGSDHDGEKLNAARLAMRLIGEEGLTWEEVFKGIPGNDSTAGNYSAAALDAAYRRGSDDGYRRGLAEGHAKSPKPPMAGKTWTAFARQIEQFGDDLSDWEQGFIESFIARGWAQPTPKQRVVFERIADKLDLECPA